jgi:hypothetical protein
MIMDEFNENWKEEIKNRELPPLIKDALQYLLNLEYLYNIYGEIKTHRMLKRLD